MSELTDRPTTARPKNIYLVSAAALGLIVGLFIGTVVLNPGDSGQGARSVAGRQAKGAYGEEYTKAFQVVDKSNAWGPAPLIWNRLGPFSKAGRAPKTFDIPTQLYDYGASTDPIQPVMVGDGIVLRVDVTDVRGVVGVSLVNPAGHPLVSEEQAVTSADGARSVMFLVKPDYLPASVLLRNYGDQSGKKGAITVKDVSYAPISAFTDAEMDALNIIGLNKRL